MAALAARAETGFGRVVGGLLGRSALGGVRSPFEAFGPLAAAARAQQPQPPAATGGGVLAGLARAATFTADEARRRLSSLIGNTFSPRSGAEFVSYLKENLLGLEKRTFAGSKGTIHVVDALTRQSVPAAAVDPRRLNERAIERVLGREAKADPRAQAEAAAAQGYREKLAPFLRAARETGRAPMRDWGDVGFTLPAAIKGRAYAVRDGEAFVGIQVGTCDTSPEKTREFLRQKQAELSAKAGRPVQFVLDREMTPGSPILVADRNLVRARRIDPSLSADRLEASFGVGFKAHYEALGRGAGMAADAGANKVVSLDEFKARFARKPAPERGFGGPAEGPGAAPAPQPGVDTRRLVVRMGEAGPQVWDTKRQREASDVPGVHGLPFGEYTKEDEFGMPVGRVRVDASGVTHTTMAGVEHNADGPSFEPRAGSGLQKRYALDGQTFDRYRDFKAAAGGAAATERAEPSPGEPSAFGAVPRR